MSSIGFEGHRHALAGQPLRDYSGYSCTKTPTNSIPFACDAGGNFYLLDRVTGRVWFMPMDEWERGETAEQNWSRSGRTVASSFQAFVDALTDNAPD